MLTTGFVNDTRGDKCQRAVDPEICILHDTTFLRLPYRTATPCQWYVIFYRLLITNF
jgi:hypothetical protein